MVEFSVNLNPGQSMERAQELTGADRPTQRYPQGSDASLEDVSDPHLAHDETRSSVIQWASEHPGWAILGSAFGLVVAGILVSLALRLFPALIENVWVRRIGVGLVLVLGSYVAGRKHQFAAFAGVDSFTFRLPNGVQRFHGELKSAGPDDRAVFVPIKGWSWLGNPGDPYTLEELDARLPLDTSRANTDGKTEARIGLDPALAAAAKTSFGGVGAQLTKGLEVYPWGRSFNIRPKVPDTAEKSRLADIRKQMERDRDEIANLQEENNQLQRQRDNALELAQKSYDENVDMFARQVQKVASAFDSDRGDDEDDDELSAFSIEEDLQHE